MPSPPILRSGPYTANEPAPDEAELTVLPLEFADFMRMQRALAASELGFTDVEASSPGDIATSLLELPALVSHVLGLYQSRNGREAFLGTARAAPSLVRHGRRLGYEPSPGVSAHGFIAVYVKTGLEGVLPERLAFASPKVGETPAQDFELIEPLTVSHSLNALLPRDRVEAIGGAPGPTLVLNELMLGGEALELATGEGVVVAYVAGGQQRYEARFVVTAEPAASGETRLVLSDSVSVPATAQVSCYCKPSLTLRAFGHDAAAAFDASPTPHVANVALPVQDVCLDGGLEVALAGGPLVRVQANALKALRVTRDANGDPIQDVKQAALKHTQVVTWQSLHPVTNAVIANNQYAVNTEHERKVTCLRLTEATAAAAVFNRPSALERSSTYLADFELELPVRLTQPSQQPLLSPLTLEGVHPGLLPGKVVALSSSVGPQIVRINTASLGASDTTISFVPVDPPNTLLAHQQGNTEILGNLGRISHGKTVNEVLGGSDGSTPFQRYKLKKPLVGHRVSAAGVTPDIEVRVAGQRYDYLPDLGDAAANDAVFNVERDELGVATVVFGDGQRGAVPPSGQRHIQATYRVGVGPVGSVPAHAIQTIKKAHPLLDRAFNPTALLGGAAPADLELVRTQAPLYLATFDRAVSTGDHARLSLLIPGVARARAFVDETSPGVEGVVLVVADEQGVAPSLSAVESFIRARRDNTLPLAVKAAGVVDIALTVAVQSDPAFEPELTKRTIRALLVGADPLAPGRLTFAARDFEQPLFASEVAEWIERVPGIVAFRINLLAVLAGATNPPGVPPGLLDTVRAGPDEWVRLEPQNLLLENEVLT